MYEQELRIAGLFAEVEESLASLYGRCRAYYLRDFELWDHLAQDEVQHGIEARRLAAMATQGSLKFKNIHAQEALLRSTLVYVEEVKQAISAGKLPGDKALDLALKIEESIVERGSFAQFETMDADLDALMKKLNHETEIHARAIRKTLEGRKPASGHSQANH